MLCNDKALAKAGFGKAALRSCVYVNPGPNIYGINDDQNHILSF